MRRFSVFGSLGLPPLRGRVHQKREQTSCNQHLTLNTQPHKPRWGGGCSPDPSMGATLIFRMAYGLEKARIDGRISASGRRNLLVLSRLQIDASAVETVPDWPWALTCAQPRWKYKSIMRGCGEIIGKKLFPHHSGTKANVMWYLRLRSGSVFENLKLDG